MQGMRHGISSYLLVAILFFSFYAAFAAYPSGLAAYLPFDSNANDIVGSYSGTVNGATLASSGGKVGGAYQFSGSSAYIALPSYNIGTGPVTFLLWVKGSAIAANQEQGIISAYNSTGPWFFTLERSTWGSGALDMYAGYSLQTPANIAGGTWGASDTSWHMVTMTRNSTSMDLYLDGALVANSSLSNFVNFNVGNKPLYIGYPSGAYFNGSIDEVAVFNRSLTPSEVSQFYNNSKDGVMNYFGDCRHACAAFGAGNLNDSSTAAAKNVFANITLATATALKNFTFSWNGTNYSFYDPSLVGMWNFEDMNYSDNFDSGIDPARWNNNNGVIANAGKARYVIPSGSSSTARSLTSYGTMTFSGSFDMQVDFSEVSTSDATESDYSMRLYNYANASNYYEIKKNILAGTDYYQMYCSGTQVSLNATSLASGKFRLVSSGSTITSYYYDGGAWKPSGSCSISPTAAYYVWLGAWDWSPSYPALTVDFDNFIVNSGQVLLDSSQYRNNATLSTAYAAPQGKYGNALAFSANGYASTPVNLTSYNAYSVALWVKPAGNGSGSSGRATIIGQDNVGDRVFTIEYDPSHAGGIGGFYTFNGNNSITGNDLPLGQWTYVVAVENKTSHWLYENGVLVNSSTGNIPASSSQTLRIGGRAYTGNNDQFNGSIDELRVYSRALSASEVQQLYLSNLRKLNSTAWEFDTNQTNLTDGTYTYAGYAADTQGYTDSTGLRSLTLA